MPHGVIDAGLSIIVLLAGSVIGLGAWLVRRHFAKQDANEERLNKIEIELEAWKLAESGIRIPVRINSHASEPEDGDGDQDSDSDVDSAGTRRVRSGKSPSGESGRGPN